MGMGRNEWMRKIEGKKREVFTLVSCVSCNVTM